MSKSRLPAWSGEGSLWVADDSLKSSAGRRGWGALSERIRISTYELGAHKHSDLGRPDNKYLGLCEL